MISVSPQKIGKKATQRTLLPLVPHYQMKSLSSLLIKINIFHFMSEIMKAIGIKDIHSFIHCIHHCTHSFIADLLPAR